MLVKRACKTISFNIRTHYATFVNKLNLIIPAIFLIVAAIALYHNISPYTTPSQLKDLKEAQGVQVVGRISKLRVMDGKTEFVLTDGQSEIKVIYNGSIQRYNTEVVVIGDWENGVLYASKILKKCHTEYTGG